MYVWIQNICITLYIYIYLKPPCPKKKWDVKNNLGIGVKCRVLMIRDISKLMQTTIMVY